MSESRPLGRWAVVLVSCGAVLVGCLGASNRATGSLTSIRTGGGELGPGPCGRLLNAEELALARLFETSPRQRRRRVRCDPVLARVARAHARDMGARRYFKHVTPDGDGPNRLVERAGYRLPPSYSTSRGGNNVEVIAAGHETAEETWRAWLKSRSHRPQVEGASDFFREQTDYGVGFASVPGSRYGTYWVLISARHR